MAEEAGWFGDPSGAFELRYHNGDGWTEHVSTAGRQQIDAPSGREGTWPAPSSVVPAATMVQPVIGGPPEPAAKGGRRRLVFGLVVAVVFIAAAAGGGIALANSGGSKPKQTASAPVTTTTTAPGKSDAESEPESEETEADTTTTTLKPEDAVGLNVADATARLEQEGKTVVVDEVIDETKPDGEVVAAEAGDTPDEVHLTVARPPVARFAEELSPVGPKGLRLAGLIQLDGQTYNHGVFFRSCDSQIGFTEFDLGRDFRQFSAIIGLSDGSNSGATYRFEVFVDSKPVESADLAFGSTKSLAIDVTNALRIKIQVTLLVRGSSSPCSEAVFANAKFVGVPSEVPPLPPK